MPALLRSHAATRADTFGRSCARLPVPDVRAGGMLSLRGWQIDERIVLVAAMRMQAAPQSAKPHFSGPPGAVGYKTRASEMDPGDCR